MLPERRISVLPPKLAVMISLIRRLIHAFIDLNLLLHRDAYRQQMPRHDDAIVNPRNAKGMRLRAPCRSRVMH
jgi:hypothetical protein